MGNELTEDIVNLWGHAGIKAYETIPVHYMRSGVIGYILYGHPIGHFLTALFENDLVESFSRADMTNTEAMRDWVSWLYNHCPMEARGNPAKVKNWIHNGGLRGLRKQERNQQNSDDLQGQPSSQAS